MKPEVLDATTVSGASAASIRANRVRLTSRFSGPFSWTRATPSTAAAGSSWKLTRVGSAPAGSPRRSSVGQAASMNSRTRTSQSGAGS